MTFDFEFFKTASDTRLLKSSLSNKYMFSREHWCSQLNLARKANRLDRPI